MKEYKQELLYIKLGETDKKTNLPQWVEECMEQNKIQIGFKEISDKTIRDAIKEDNEDILKEEIKREYSRFDKDGNLIKEGSLKNRLRPILYFYLANEKTKWVTNYNGKLWVATNAEDITLSDDNKKVRNMKDNWKELDTPPLNMSHNTVCQIHTEKDRVLKAINNLRF